MKDRIWWKSDDRNIIFIIKYNVIAKEKTFVNHIFSGTKPRKEEKTQLYRKFNILEKYGGGGGHMQSEWANKFRCA